VPDDAAGLRAANARLRELKADRDAEIAVRYRQDADQDGAVLAVTSGTRGVSAVSGSLRPSAHPTTLAPVHSGCGDR
jgi:hypothetical protein